ncbi:MAG: trypsin-like peptidase domain-containing protein, partial [Akkermansiaceae bacterium]
MKLITSILTAAALSSATGLAQNAGALPAEQRINGKLVWAAFGPQQAVVQASSAVIYKDAKSRDLAIYGTVVSEDGFILTKASEIEGAEHLSLRIGGDLYKEVKLIATDPRWDVAVLKVQPEAPLKPIVLSDESDIEQGKWVVSNGSTMRRERRIKVGIVSAVTREITGKQSRVILGVGLGDESDKGVKIRQVSDKGGAEKAGLKKGDILQ